MVRHANKLFLILIFFACHNALAKESGYFFSCPKPLCFHNPYATTSQEIVCSAKKGICRYHQGKIDRGFDGSDSCHHFFSGFIKDVIQLNLNLFSWQSFQIIAGIFPAVAGARMVDEDLQSYFFSHRTHKNQNCFPHWCKDVARLGISVPIVLFGLDAFFSSDEDKRTTGWVFLLGMPFVIFGKDLIKKAEFDCSLRPWHEKWCSNHKRSYGGFPSGHMAELSYIAILYGMRFGPRYAIPLGIYAGALGVIFLNCNRHYLSQFIGGIGLGALYAVAANKLIESKLNDSVSAGLGCDTQGNPALQLSMKF